MTATTFRSDLAVYTAVYVESIEAYMVCLPQNKKVYQGNLEFSVSYDKNTVIMNSIDGLYYKTNSKALSHYTRIVNGKVVQDVVSIDEYNKAKAELNININDDGDYETNRDRLLAAIFEDEYHKQYTDVVTHVPITITLIGKMVKEIESPYISCILNIGQVAKNNFYTLNIRGVEIEVIDNYLNQYQAENPKTYIDNNRQNYMRWVKVNGVYIFEDYWEKNRPAIFYGSYDECVKKEQQVREYTTNYLKQQFFIKFTKVTDALNEKMLCEVVDKLNTIHKKASNIDYKVADRTNYNSLCNSISELRDSITKLAK